MASVITKEHEAVRMDEELSINFFAHLLGWPTPVNAYLSLGPRERF
jgi:hypothetical protein